MAFKLEFETGNAAFADAGSNAASEEIARILESVAEQFRRGVYTMNAASPIRDINGNRVGDWRYSDDD